MNNITWQNGGVTRADRCRINSQQPQVLWFTGLSGSGKSTVAVQTEKILSERGYRAYLLDGDNVRHGLNTNLGFSETDRTENIRRIAEAASLIADSGAIVLVSVISPMISMRESARKIITEKNIGFTEIYVSADIDTCISRDPKGLYKKAIAGEIKGFTGIDAPYESPLSPEIILETASRTIESCASEIAEYVISHQIDYKKLLDVIIPTALDAGRAILDIYSSCDFSVEYKKDDSPLTAADKASNDIIVRALTENFPQYSLLTEESADNLRRLRERYCFIVDPLDGTKEFIKHNGEFTVNIALAFDGLSVLGVIYVPVTDTLYYAAHGLGAFRKIGNAVPERIHTSERTDRLVLMNSRSHGNDVRMEQIISDPRIAQTISAGSSLKGCEIAEGKADIYYRYGYTCEWDTAAMQCICEEAGAVFMQCDDTEMTYNRRNTLNEKGFYILNRAENILHGIRR